MTIAYKCCNCPRTKYVSWNGYCGDGYPVELAILGALTEELTKPSRLLSYPSPDRSTYCPSSPPTVWSRSSS